MLLIIIPGCKKEEPIENIFEDPLLEEAVREKLGIISEENIEPGKLLSITELSLDSKGISSLKGLEYCNNLTYLRFYGNSVKDITPLENLIKLNDLQFAFNNVSNITPLRKLINLKVVNIGANPIKNIEVLGSLSELNFLWAYSTLVEDFTVLSNLNNLMSLIIHRSNLSNEDITFLNDAINIKQLTLSYNNLSGIQALKNMQNLMDLDLSYNQITDLSVIKTIFDKGAFKYWIGNTRFTFSRLNIEHNNMEINTTTPQGIINKAIVDELLSKGVNVIYTQGNKL